MEARLPFGPGLQVGVVGLEYLVALHRLAGQVPRVHGDILGDRGLMPHEIRDGHALLHTHFHHSEPSEPVLLAELREDVQQDIPTLIRHRHVPEARWLSQEFGQWRETR